MILRVRYRVSSSDQGGLEILKILYRPTWLGKLFGLRPNSKTYYYTQRSGWMNQNGKCPFMIDVFRLSDLSNDCRTAKSDAQLFRNAGIKNPRTNQEYLEN